MTLSIGKIDRLKEIHAYLKHHGMFILKEKIK
jgi:hypothetical protein